MAASDDAVTRKGVADALRSVASSLHPDIHENGLEILAALPAEESAPLSDLAVGWLSRENRSFFLQAPEKLLKKLAEAGQKSAALIVAQSLLQIGTITARSPASMVTICTSITYHRWWSR
jgi:hypothetical protein